MLKSTDDRLSRQMEMFAKKRSYSPGVFGNVVAELTS